MKSNTIVILFALLVSSLSAQTDAIDRFFSKYQEHDDFTVVFISPKMFNMMGSGLEGKESSEFKEIVKDIKSLKILTASDNEQKYYKEFTKKLPKNEYEVLLNVREKDQNVQFFTKESGNQIQELLLMVGGDEFVLMSFTGNLDLNKISKLTKSMNISGSEHLLKVKDKKK